VSALIRAEVQQAWFLHGPSFVIAVLNTMKDAGSHIASNAQRARSHSDVLRSVMRDSVLLPATQTVQNTKLVASHTIDRARELVRSTSADLYRLSEVVSQKTDEIGHTADQRLRLATKKVATVAQDVALKVQETGKKGAIVTKHGIEKAQAALYLTSEVIVETASKFSVWIQLTWSNAIYNANLAYCVHLEEKERKRRMTSTEETFAIINGMKVASLIKDLAPEFYRPSNEPNPHYSFKLLESREQAARIKDAKLDATLRFKHRAVANLIADRFRKLDTWFELKPLAKTTDPLQVEVPESMQIFEERREISEIRDPIELEPVSEKIEEIFLTPRSFTPAM